MGTKTTSKKILPWRKSAKALDKKLKDADALLSGLLDEAGWIKHAADLERETVIDDYNKRVDIERALGNIEQTAGRLIAFVGRLEKTITYKTDRELVSRALEEAQRVCRADYWQDVRDVADEFTKQWRDGEFEDREQAIEWLEQTVDGHGRVIMTYQAQECLLYSDNDGAYIDELGTDGVVKDGSINWSALACMAFKADILEHINQAEDIDVNDDPPQKIDDHNFQGGTEQCQHEDGDGEKCEQRKALHKS